MPSLFPDLDVFAIESAQAARRSPSCDRLAAPEFITVNVGKRRTRALVTADHAEETSAISR